jgi:hypothetical protein
MPGAFGIFIVSMAHTDERIGLWLRAYDPEADTGYGVVDLTSDPLRAKRYASPQEAWDEYRAAPKSRPLRPDGKPNRPLTAYTVLCTEIPNCG